MTTKIKEDIIITTPIGTKLNIQKDMIIKNPDYSNRYDPIYEETTIVSYLSWLEGEDRENYIELEKNKNPIQFKKFMEDFPELFENHDSLNDRPLLKLYNKGKNISAINKIPGLTKQK